MSQLVSAWFNVWTAVAAFACVFVFVRLRTIDRIGIHAKPVFPRISSASPPPPARRYQLNGFQRGLIVLIFCLV